MFNGRTRASCVSVHLISYDLRKPGRNYGEL